VLTATESHHHDERAAKKKGGPKPPSLGRIVPNYASDFFPLRQQTPRPSLNVDFNPVILSSSSYMYQTVIPLRSSQYAFAFVRRTRYSSSSPSSSSSSSATSIGRCLSHALQQKPGPIATAFPKLSGKKNSTLSPQPQIKLSV